MLSYELKCVSLPGILKLSKCGDKTSNRKGEEKCRKQAIIGYILPDKDADTPMQVFCVHIQILTRDLNNVRAHSSGSREKARVFETLNFF